MGKKPSMREFTKWRTPIRGKANPDVMNNAFWEWCVRSGESAYGNNKEFDGPCSSEVGPCWCFQRMGQSELTLPDGRQVFIAGEHEDHYDPDFYIYNDVVILDQDNMEILGYSELDFPPTDFHSATLVGSDIYVIGNLGYPADRVVGQTQVYRLSIDDWRMTRVESSGAMPGWIHRHKAVKSEEGNAIVVSGGELYGDRILENFNEFRLCLNSLTWTQLTDRCWERWILERKDGDHNQLWNIRHENFRQEVGMARPDQEAAYSQFPPEVVRQMFPEFSEQQLEQIKTLYQSPFAGEIAKADKNLFNRFELDVDGIKVRFDEDMYHVTVTIEGELPTESVNAIVNGLKEKLSVVENAAYQAINANQDH